MTSDIDKKKDSRMTSEEKNEMAFNLARLVRVSLMYEIIKMPQEQFWTGDLIEIFELVRANIDEEIEKLKRDVPSDG